MAPTYDLMLLLDSAAPGERRRKIVSDVESAISDQGTLIGKHDWGERTLAYEIDHRVDADYYLFQFTGAAPLLESLQRTLRLTDGVLRFRLIKLAPGTPEPPTVTPEPRAARPREEAPAAEEAPAEETGAEAEAAAAE